jgi:dihydroxyacid dehydratase/phosphogluconate dehydratase
MGSPAYYTDATANESGHVRFDIEWTSAVSGGVPALSAFPHPAAGYVVSVVHGATGVYTITLTDQWADLLEFGGWTIQATYSAAGACNIRVTANNTNAAAKTLVLLVTNAAGAAVDPTTNDVLYVNLRMQSYQA